MYVRGNWMFFQVEKGDFVASERVLEQATEGKPHTFVSACSNPDPFNPPRGRGV